MQKSDVKGLAVCTTKWQRKDKERYQKEMEKYVPMSDAELNKLKQKAEKEKKRRAKTAFKMNASTSVRDDEKRRIFRRTRDHQRAQLTQEMWKRVGA